MLQGTFVSPRTPLESLIAEVWKDVLGVDRVGVYDNFFDLGGHSLLSMQVIARVEKKTGLQIHPKAFVTQTLGQLASVYEERMRVARPVRPLRLTRWVWDTIRSAFSPRKDTAL
jgi:acyl carrier protein